MRYDPPVSMLSFDHWWVASLSGDNFIATRRCDPQVVMHKNIGETEDTNNEGNETQNEDDMDGIDVQADQESGPAQIESEWNDTVTAVPHAVPFRGRAISATCRY